LLVIVVSHAAPAQTPIGVGGRSELFAGSDLERYLRYLQTDGRVARYPWTIRAFSPREIDSLVPRTSGHPWALRYDLAERVNSNRPTIDIVWPAATVRFNSAFPYGRNDGPIWAGRGLTTALSGGVAARWKSFSMSVVPILFRAENTSFPLMPNGEIGALQFADRQYPFRVDRPQRFGRVPYSLFDPGQSFVRFDSRIVTVGASTADQWWGPTDIYPFLIGNNAAGFPHVFVGTGMPFNLWIARLHARIEYGELSQSAYSSMPNDSASARRFASGIVLGVQPRWVSGLELGAARFFHSPWPSGGLRWSDFTVPVEAFYKKAVSRGTGQDDQRNQLASLFLRWVLPRSGFEVYLEYGKEDHNWDLRDFLLEPDHAASMSVGLRKLWSLSPDRMIGVRGEHIDQRFNTLSRTRDIGGGYYLHSVLRQGHTERGQLLGADVAAGSGAGSMLAVDAYGRRGRLTFEWTRTTVDTLGLFPQTMVESPRVPDVQQALGANALLFVGPVDVTAGLTAVYELNRYFAGDGFNLNAILGARWRW
jgi:hypothetical protein